MTSMVTLVDRPDGRVLRVEEGGDPHGLPVLTHHGTPGSGRLYERHAADAAEKGIRLIGYDRPGYGGSSPLPGRVVAHCAADVRAIAAALHIERLGLWGVSGGGPHALACAALLPDLLVGAASLASPAPYGAAGLDYFSGMGQENADDTRLTLADEPAARQKAGRDRESLLAMSAEALAGAFPTLLSPVDAAAFTPELSNHFYRSSQEGLAPGVEGWWDDGLSTLQRWGFELGSIRVPVQLWHGRHDGFVPFQHGEWLAAQIPGVEAHLTDEDGHLTLLQDRVPDVHAWLLERF